LPKSNEDILRQIQAGHFVLLPCYNPITENYFDFHRVTNCYEIFNKSGITVFEVGSLVKNHDVTTNPNKPEKFVKLPSFYKYSPNFTPGALVIQMAVTKILREEFLFLDGLGEKDSLIFNFIHFIYLLRKRWLTIRF
jgi:hypothetical protein